MFHVIHDSSIVLRERGVFRQAKLYRRDRSRSIYAGWGSWFIRLVDLDGGTSKPNTTYEDIDVGFTLEKDQLGRPMLPANFTEKE